MKKLISIFYDIRREEWQPVLIMFGLHFFLLVILYFLKPARDSLFLTQNGPDELPYVYILLAIFSMPITSLLTNFMTRFDIQTVLGWAFAILAVNILFIRWLFQIGSNWIFMLFYVWVGLFGILVISLYWLLANGVFKPAQSKRIFPFLTLGAILGAIAGSETSSLFVSMTGLPTEDLLYICVILLFLCMLFLMMLDKSKTNLPTRTDQQKKESPSIVKSAHKILSSPYQLVISSIIGITMLVTTFTDYQFKVLAFNAYPETEQLTAFVGTFYAGISLSSLAIQMLLSSQIIKRTGMVGAILSRPVSMMIGAVLMAVEPVLASVVILNGFDGATRYSIDKTGRELLFLPVSQHTKEQTKIFIDIFIDRFARGLGGFLLLGFILVLNWSVYLITYVVIGLLFVWIYLGMRAKQGYVEKFRDSLQKQLISPTNITLNLDETSIRRVVKESLHASQDTQLLHTLFLLENTNNDPLAEDLHELLKHPKKEIRLQALILLQDVERESYTGDVQELLNDKDPEIRLEAIYYLCRHSKEDPSHVIRSYLHHKDIKLKSAALGCACKHSDTTPALIGKEEFDQLLEEEGKDVVVIKAQLAAALGYIPDNDLATIYLPKLIENEHPSVVRKAIFSMGQQKDDRFVPLLINKLNEPEYTFDIREALAEFGTDHLILYKDRFLNKDFKHDLRKRIPGIFSHLPSQESVDHLLDMIRIQEPDLRYHVIKALNKIKRHKPDIQLDTSIIRKTLERESRNYFDLLSVKLLQPIELPNKILLRALTEKMDQAIERIFRLLGLVYDAKDMHGTYLGIQSFSSEKKSAAVEFLDNVLDGHDHRYIFPIVDERDESQKLRIGKRLFDIPSLRYDQGLMQLMEGDDLWLRACAIYSVSPVCPNELQMKVDEERSAGHPLIRETAQLVKKRNASESKV